MKKIFVILIIFIYSGLLNAATYNYYFSDDPAGNPTGNDTTGNGTIGNPWKTLQKAENVMKVKNSSDVVNLYFDRGDTWTYNTESLGGAANVFQVSSNDPTVHIDAYGSGNKPVFDGLVTNFSTVPYDNCPGAGAPCRYSRFFIFYKRNCSLSNVEIKNVYGHAIFLGSGSNDGDGFKMSNNTIHNIGNCGIAHSPTLGAEDITVENNIFYDNQELYGENKMAAWSAAVCLSFGQAMSRNNLVKHNLIYDIHGEGITAPNSISEYNIVGDTTSTGINTAVGDFDALSAIVRYNLIINSDWSTGLGNPSGGGQPLGIRVFDEVLGGDNSAADISIYGNIVINRSNGIWVFNGGHDQGNRFGRVKIYNNTFIDSHYTNMLFYQPEDFLNMHIYNNTSILYDRTGASHVNNVTPGTDWVIDNNAFWTTGGLPVVPSAFQNNYINSNPLLPGEPAIDWDGQTGPTYFTNIKFLDIYPQENSSLINSGKTLGTGFNNNFLSTGTNWSADPTASTWQLASQGSSWDIGAIVNNGGSVNTAPIVNAGSDQTITMPTDTIDLNGTVTDDGLPNPPGALTYLWIKQSGPAGGIVTFNDPNAVDTTAAFSKEGTYVLRLSADDSDLQTHDDVTITVNGDTTPPDAPEGLEIVE